jgi:hypothetical protein
LAIDARSRWASANGSAWKAVAAASKAPGAAQKAVPVELAHVARALRGRVELGGERIGVAALADEVVGGHPHDRRHLHAALQRDDRVEEQLARDEALEAPAEILDHDAAHVAAGGDAALVAEVAVHQRVQVAGVRGQVVGAVGGEAAPPEAAQVGDDHLEARIGERRDDAPPDPHRLVASRGRAAACPSPRGRRRARRPGAPRPA